MNVTLEKNDNGSAKLIVNVVENDYKEKVEKQLREIGRTHNIPGFRKGHVSLGQLTRLFGKQVKSDVLNREVYEAVINYIKDNNLNILGEPMPIEVKEISLEDKDFTFEYEIGLAPEFNVTLDKNVTLPYYKIEVTDEMKQQQDKALRERFGSQVPGEEFEERALVKGPIQQLNEDGTVNTNEDAIQVTAGIVAPFLFKSKEEADKFVGKKVGDKVRFNPYNTCDGNVAELASMLNIDKEKAPEVKGDFEIAISEIIVNKLAEHNQEFYDEVFGKDKVTSEEDYYNNIEQMIAAQLAPNSDNLFRIMAEKQLVADFGNFELPAEFLKKWLASREEALNEKNIDEEFVKIEPQIKWELISNRIAEQAGYKIEEADLEGFAKAIAQQQLAQYGMYNLDDETLGQYATRILNDKNSRMRIAQQVNDIKLFNAIRNMANTEVKTVSLDEFKNVAEAAQK